MLPKSIPLAERIRRAVDIRPGVVTEELLRMIRCADRKEVYKKCDLLRDEFKHLMWTGSVSRSVALRGEKEIQNFFFGGRNRSVVVSLALDDNNISKICAFFCLF